MKPDIIDTYHDSAILCPYCGEVYDSYALESHPDGYDGHETVCWCDACEKDFTSVMFVEVSFESYKLPEDK